MTTMTMTMIVVVAVVAVVVVVVAAPEHVAPRPVVCCFPCEPRSQERDCGEGRVLAPALVLVRALVPPVVQRLPSMVVKMVAAAADVVVAVVVAATAVVAAAVVAVAEVQQSWCVTW